VKLKNTLQFQTAHFILIGMKRQYDKLLNEYLSIFPVVAILGARQCGKTTICRMRGDDWQYFDLEKPSDFEQIAKDPELFFRLHPDKIIIDEAQLMPQLFPVLRGVIDSDRTKKGRFILTGSSSPQLQSAISESLAGRIGTIEMAPLSFSETVECAGQFVRLLEDKTPISEWRSILTQKGTIQAAFDYWYRGGYPEPWIENSPRFSQVWMDNYIDSYLFRDVARLFPGLNKERFRKFIYLLGSLSGSVQNYSDIARTLDLSQPTIKDYFAIVHGTFLWRTIPAYSPNTSKRLLKHPKGYIRDSGILHNLIQISSQEQLLSHIRMGDSWESMVIEEILRQGETAGIRCDYSYYRTSAGAEVDLILEGRFGIVPIEIKFGQALKRQHLIPMKNFIEEFNLPFGVLVNNGESVQMVDEKIIMVPFNFL